MIYTVQVSRYDGSDVAINDCQVANGYLSPTFDPVVTDYQVQLPAEQDYINLQFVPWDTGQTFEVAALPPTIVSATSRRLDERRLMPSNLPGEVQQSVVERRFPLEVG